MLGLISEIVFCLIVAAILGGFIGYLIGRIKKCEQESSFSQKKEKDPAKIAKERLSEVTNSRLMGIKPPTLEKPENGVADDLKEISGIGIKIEDALNSLGIFHFHQIANWTQDNINWIDNYLVFKGRVNREDWVNQAKLLAVGGSKKTKD